jgi:threonine 3-dehydrogenase
LYQWDAWAARNDRTAVLLGREIGGEFVAGSDVTTVTVGQRVSAETYSCFGACQQCLASRRHTCLNLRLFSNMGLGGFCDFTVAPDSVLRPMGADLSFAQISVLQPIGIGVRLTMEANISAWTALACGCGPVGLFAIEASSKEHAIRGALSVFAPAGVMLVAGMPKAPPTLEVARLLIAKVARLQGVHGRSIDERWLAAKQLLRFGNLIVDTILTHTFRLADYDEAFHLAATGKAGKVLSKLPQSALVV